MIIPCLLTFRDEKEGDLDSKRYNIECNISRLDLKQIHVNTALKMIYLDDLFWSNPSNDVTNIYRYLFYLNLN